MLLFSAVLSLLVGFLIVMLVFYISTIEKIPVFACLKALAASNADIRTIVGLQVVIVFVAGCLLAGGALHPALELLKSTTISVVVTNELVVGSVGTMEPGVTPSSLLSLRQLIKTEPGDAFRT